MSRMDDLLDEDHPRSRGVYKVENLPNTMVCGSSPLARGLLHVHVPHKIRFGIIPARAGFTGRPSPGS